MTAEARPVGEPTHDTNLTHGTRLILSERLMRSRAAFFETATHERTVIKELDNLRKTIKAQDERIAKLQAENVRLCDLLTGDDR